MLKLGRWAYANYKINTGQMCILKWIASRGQEPILMADVSKITGHSTAAATGLIDRLENLGFVSRSHPENDHRKVIVSITKKGLKVLSDWDKYHRESE
jgi:DNA-binding MarR family transcriptional regulator